MNRDMHRQVRLSRTWSSLTLKISRDGTPTTTVGNLFQHLTTLTAKYFFLISNLNLLSLVLSPQTLLKSLSPSSLLFSLRHWQVAPRSPQNLLFFMLNSPSSLSLSSQERCSIPWIIFVAFLWTHSNWRMLPLYWGLSICRGADLASPLCWHQVFGVSGDNITPAESCQVHNQYFTYPYFPKHLLSMHIKTKIFLFGTLQF